jgi:DNA-binding transcriptional regulator YiaG
MGNLGGVLREEIGRLSRREIRKAVESTKKATNQHRHSIAALKSQVAQLERQVAALVRTIARLQPAATAARGNGATTPKLRFSPKGLRAHRARLGLSAGDLGKLIGVSAQSVYNWELGHSVPHSAQLAKLGPLRSMGKREAARRLEAAS